MTKKYLFIQKIIKPTITNRNPKITNTAFIPTKSAVIPITKADTPNIPLPTVPREVYTVTSFPIETLR